MFLTKNDPDYKIYRIQTFILNKWEDSRYYSDYFFDSELHEYISHIRNNVQDLSEYRIINLLANQCNNVVWQAGAFMNQN